MKTKYKYIHFEPFPGMPGDWLCKNNKSKIILAEIVFDPQWRRYVSSDTNPNAIFSGDCHTDIADFLEQLNKER